MIPMQLVMNAEGCAVTRVGPPYGDLPEGWSYAVDDGRTFDEPPAATPASIPLGEVISAMTTSEYAALSIQPDLMQALFAKMAEAIAINPKSNRVRELLQAGGLSEARIAELLQAPVA